jgi:Stage II sporulation protein E (SpoIIE)
VLFSDGVTDARDEGDEEFGEERLFEILRASVGEPGMTLIERVFTAIDAFAGGAPPFDDITMLVARRLPVGAAGPSFLRDEALAEVPLIGPPGAYPPQTTDAADFTIVSNDTTLNGMNRDRGPRPTSGNAGGRA